MKTLRTVLCCCVFSILISSSFAQEQQHYPVKKVLIVVEGTSNLKNYAMGDGRQLVNLLGHFSTAPVLKGVAEYKSGELNNFDYIFYIGYTIHNSVPTRFLDDVYKTNKTVVWLNTGMEDFGKHYDLKKKFGFSVTGIDTLSGYDQIRINTTTLAKDEPRLNVIKINNQKFVTVMATARSTTKRRESPYAISAKNLIYFADSPFAYAEPGSHYLYFSDLLHDILKEEHETSHRAMIRIEDITVFDNPDKLREIADILSSRDIPFMVGVIPYFVDPGEGIRVSLSDKPDLVDALQYMVHNGGTIVMHGVTHQYRGVTATDFEFWDDNTNAPIKGETEEEDSRKIEMGIQEFMKNGLYPLVWETPHYTASFTLYKTVAKYFSTACEQRLALEDADFSQYFPYIINKDIFGQTVYPENLGYVPLSPDKQVGEQAVEEIIKNAKAHLYVRDGIATAFFHAFLDLDLLKQLVDGIEGLGYSFLDMREQTHWVRTKDRIILAGSQDYTMTFKDQYLLEAYYDKTGEVRYRNISEKRLLGTITKKITLAPGEFYKAEPLEFREHEPSFMEKLVADVSHLFDNLFTKEENWKQAKVMILWNHFAHGALFNDQASFASVFRSLNIQVDTAFLGQPLHLDTRHNLLIVPAAIADSLRKEDITAITQWVTNGGNIILDTKTELAEEFDFSFAKSRLNVRTIKDEIFPEEHISWRYAELVTKFDADNIDKVFCVDAATDAPLVVGKRYGNGKILYFNSRFDPHSQLGYSQYPYLMEYVRRYFQLRPIVRQEQLEFYFDPGFRHTYSIENLVRSWVNNGIRVVHVAGWHQYPKYTYDYARLIRLAHANGILVYAWLEPPQISQMFWNNHPEWREKNITGEDVRASWRYQVALTDTQCVKEMNNIFRTFLESYDWDGVSLAELYFESGRGFEQPNLFTPAHPTARAELKQKYGIDLKAALDTLSPSYWKKNPAVKETIVNYRVQKLASVYETLLNTFSEIAHNKPGFEIIVTALDNFGSPELREQYGIDMHTVLDLQKRYGFVLQVEDPQSRWSSDPYRYAQMRKQYGALVDSSKLMLDLNILRFRDDKTVTPFPTLVQTGTESYHLIKAAGLGIPRLTVYSEASVNPQDLTFFANALASNVQYKEADGKISTNSPQSFVLRLPKEITEIILDGTPLPPFRDNRYFIPAGEHQISISPQSASSFSAQELQTRIMSTSGNITDASYGLRDVSLSYESVGRMLISLSNMPTAVLVDGQPIQFTALKGNDCFSVFLPEGSHTAIITTGDRFAYGVNVTSFWSTTAIAVFSALAVSMLLIMYFSLRVLRRTSAHRKA
jgi:uncharacterized protein YdaL